MSASPEALQLKRQLCFPLYASAKAVVRLYRPLLDKLDLTYTQYLVLLVLWEEGETTVKALGQRLFLDSGTLTPVLKALEKKRYVRRQRSEADERVTQLSLTEEGWALRDQALSIPQAIRNCVPLSEEEAKELYQLLYRILAAIAS